MSTETVDKQTAVARYLAAQARVEHTTRLIREYLADDDQSAADDVRHYDYLDAVEAEASAAAVLIQVLTADTVKPAQCTCPSCTDAAAGTVNGVSTAGVNVWNEHTNDIGDHCPFSGTEVDDDNDDQCPQGCRASAIDGD